MFQSVRGRLRIIRHEHQDGNNSGSLETSQPTREPCHAGLCHAAEEAYVQVQRRMSTLKKRKSERDA
jgi:hypothetical protein